MNITIKHMLAISKSGIMREAIDKNLEHTGLKAENFLSFTYENLGDFYDALVDAMSNDAPEVSSFEAEQDKGA